MTLDRFKPSLLTGEMFVWILFNALIYDDMFSTLFLSP